jgi:hypothetical protein
MLPKTVAEYQTDAMYRNHAFWGFKCMTMVHNVGYVQGEVTVLRGRLYGSLGPWGAGGEGMTFFVRFDARCNTLLRMRGTNAFFFFLFWGQW